MIPASAHLAWYTPIHFYNTFQKPYWKSSVGATYADRKQLARTRARDDLYERWRALPSDAQRVRMSDSMTLDEVVQEAVVACDPFLESWKAAEEAVEESPVAGPLGSASSWGPLASAGKLPRALSNTTKWSELGGGDREALNVLTCQRAEELEQAVVTFVYLLLTFCLFFVGIL